MVILVTMIRRYGCLWLGVFWCSCRLWFLCGKWWGWRWRWWLGLLGELGTGELTLLHTLFHRPQLRGVHVLLLARSIRVLGWGLTHGPFASLVQDWKVRNKRIPIALHSRGLSL